MLNREIVHQDFASVEERFASLVDGARDLSLSLAVQEGARAALVRAQEDVAIEAQDVLSQADEALVLG